MQHNILLCIRIDKDGKPTGDYNIIRNVDITRNFDELKSKYILVFIKDNDDPNEVAKEVIDMMK